MAKAKVAPPIDRPLSKAYVRKFTGWSTAAPPGLSDPTSFRKMHNCMVTPVGALRVRPGLRHVLTEPTLPIIGTYEHFYTAYDTRAILFAVREEDASVGFRVGVYNDSSKTYDVKSVLDATYGFAIPEAEGEGLDWDWDFFHFSDKCTYVKFVQIDNKILALSNAGEPMRIFKVGATRTLHTASSITFPRYQESDRLSVFQPTQSWIDGPQTAVPTAATATDTTLVSTDETKNSYNFAYFYTFNGEIGESAPSQVTQIRVQRGLSQWASDPVNLQEANDQLAAVMPELVWETAKWQKAISWNLYMFSWTDQMSVPVEGVLLKSKEIQNTTYAETGWITHTPLLQGYNELHPIPSENDRENYTISAQAGNGLTAGDRVVLVLDGEQEAKITWSSNQQGEYINFSGSKGGGYKTLSSGNLYFPAAGKLWQNPQSVDTLTVLCMGLDGYGASYYMNAGTTVSAQNQTVTIMGFEETTATPGTVSPFGVEVLNSSLYHPLDSNLMKTVAANYRISHSFMADDIQNIWRGVPQADKRRMVSSQLDNTLYYLVRSPTAWEDAELGDNGNQIWLCATGDASTWSCWDVRGTSLRKLELAGLLYMTVVQDGCIFAFDPEYVMDDIWDGSRWAQQQIDWEIVTNTQGANKAHDAWCLLQQANVTFGDLLGESEYGISGKDVHGKQVELVKRVESPIATVNTLEPRDNQDHLLIRRHLMEWEFFWRSTKKPGHGAINYLQYRYTPATVNVGYEYGSIETFEYGSGSDSTLNGVPTPFVDVSRP